MGLRSREIIRQYSIQNIAEAIITALN